MYILAARFVQDLRGKISPTEKAVAYTMAVHATEPPRFSTDPPAGIATMSMATLARESGLAYRQTASDIVKRLVAIGIIAPVDGTVSKGGGRGEKTRTTAYIFTMTVKPDSGVWKTSAAEERAAAAEVSATQPANMVPEIPENRGQCNPAVALKSENTEVSAIPQLHEGLPSSSFFDFRDGSTPIGGSGDAVPDESPAIPDDAVPPARPVADPREHSNPDTSLLRPENNPVVVGAKRPLSLDKQKMQRQRESRSDAVIADARRRQVERQTPVREIFREAKAIFDAVRQEYRTWDALPRAERDAQWDLPHGRAIENALKANAEHKAEFAEMYRTLGREVTLAKWRDFLMTEDITVTAKGEGEIERTYLMEHFIELNGVSTSEVKP